MVEAADSVPVSLVGGTVRDILLDRLDGADIDVVVEGDAIGVAVETARRLGLRASTHPRFGTAEIHLVDGSWIDLVGARREEYPHPGALPVVSPGSLDDDLSRRDVTVNAMAIRLNGSRAGELVDPRGGRADIASRLVRVLHAGSFRDDPSRVLRVARYAARLNFAIEAETRRLAQQAAGGLELSSARVGDELVRTLQEDDAAAGSLTLAANLGVPWIRNGGRLVATFDALQLAVGGDGAPHIPMWPLRLAEAVPPALLEGDVAIPGWALGMARAANGGAELAARLRDVRPMSAIDRIMRAVPPPQAIAACAAGAEVVEQWWKASASVDLAINGHDLIDAGVAPGRTIGVALDRLRERLLDGEGPTTWDGQLAAALEHIRSMGPP